MKKKILYYFLTLLFISSFAFAETNNNKNVQEFKKEAYIYTNQYKDYGKAIELLERAVVLGTDDAGVFLNLGINYLFLEQFDKAETNFEKAIILKPNYVEAYSNLATVYKVMKEYKLAIKNYKKAIEINPEYAEMYSNLGKVYITTKEYAEAAQVLEKAAKLKPLSTSSDVHLSFTYSNLGYAYIMLNNYDSAESVLLKAKELYMKLGDQPNLDYTNQLLKGIKEHR